MMRFALATFALCTTLLVAAQVEFSKSQNWDEIKQAAREQNKLIFIDAYTDWCGWCKVMDKETFSKPEVGEFQNSQFVNYKLEMEKEELGVLLSMKYGVASFPSFLLFNAEGELLTILGGYQPAAPWLADLGEAVSNPAPDRPGLSATLEMDWPEFYALAFATGKDRKFPEAEVVLTYLSNHPLTEEIAFRVASRFTHLLTEEIEEQFISQRQQLSELYGKDLVDGSLQNILARNFYSYIEQKDEKGLNAAVDKFMSFFPENKQVRQNLTLTYLQRNKEYNRLQNFMNDEYHLLPSTAINSVCWDLYENCEEEEVLTSSLIWMEKAVQQEPSYAHLDTYAALLYKTGNLEKAETTAITAIETGKAAGENVKDTEKLLAKITEARTKP